ncbi:heavy-metal-associated domain-containing protein [Candidatus Oscillochloris fontis]|uniref:heavy-metal-associated domain-containing protein n=1 Tax=Candidatus Oscillochloris fontis TaxID=2496868 RepID=UPI00101C8292|nr:hypothetical protein [Candidatus Oscillochloris fontis]
MPRQILRIHTMCQQHDRRILLAVLNDLPGVTHVRANLAEHILYIEHTEALSLATILHTIRDAGYTANVLV